LHAITPVETVLWRQIKRKNRCKESQGIQKKSITKVSL
jgi:hypothetical protein